MSRIRRALLPALCYIILIFAVSSIPSLRAPGPDFFSKDKVAHVLEYFVLGVLMFNGAGWTVGRSRAANFAFVLTVCASIGALDEVYQSFVPGRYMSMYDWSADAFGAALGSGLLAFSGRGKGPPGGARSSAGSDEGESE